MRQQSNAVASLLPGRSPIKLNRDVRSINVTMAERLFAPFRFAFKVAHFVAFVGRRTTLMNQCELALRTGFFGVPPQHRLFLRPRFR
jgi:hypothetical protein